MEPSSASPNSAPTAMTDSPWFWVYAFATVGLGLLVLIGPKWVERQIGLDQRAQGIRHSMSPVSGEEVIPARQREAAAARSAIEIRWRRQFQVLVGLLGIGLSIAWLVFFGQRRRARREMLSEAMRG
jgi:hypothetical protein